MSPLLFNLSLEPLSRMFASTPQLKISIKIGGEEVKSAMFAND